MDWTAVVMGGAIGAAQGYLMMPTLSAVGYLSRALLAARSEDSGWGDAATVGALGIVAALMHLAVAETGREMIGGGTDYTRAFVVGAFVGFASFAIFGSRRPSDPA